MIWMQRNWFCTPQHDLFFFHLYMFTAPSVLLKLTKALQFDRIVVCPLLTVAFIPRLSVQAEAIFADFLSKKQAFIRIYGGVGDRVVRNGATNRRVCLWSFSQEASNPELHIRYFYIYMPKILKDTATQNS